MYRPRRPYNTPPAQRPPARPYVPQVPARGPVAKVERHPLLEALGIQDRFSFTEVTRHIVDLTKRFPKRQGSQDLTKAVCHFAQKSKAELSIPLNVSIDFNLKTAGNTVAPEPATTTAVTVDGIPTRYFVRVIVLSGAQDEDAKAKTKLHLSKRLMLLLARKEHAHVLPIGGEWSAEKDGAKPNDESFKKTAIRSAKELLGLDLSICKKWTKFVEFYYNREDGTRSQTVVFIPNVWDHFKDGLHPAVQVKEEEKEVTEEVEEEIDDPEDSTKKKTVKKPVTSTKKVQTPLFRPYEMSLYSLLEYDCTKQSPDELSELCLFSDLFDEMLQRDFALEALEILKSKKAEFEAGEAEKKRKREEEEANAAAKKQKTEEEQKQEEAAAAAAATAAPVAVSVETKPKTTVQHIVNQDILTPFQYLDKQSPSGTVVGHLKRDILEGILYQLGQHTKYEIDELLAANGLKRNAPAGLARTPPPVLYYIKLATTTKEVPVPEEEKPAEEVKPETAESTPVEAPTETVAAAPTETAAPMEQDEEEGAEQFTEESLTKMLIKDLKTMCESRGLNVNGKKAELVARLLEAGK